MKLSEAIEEIRAWRLSKALARVKEFENITAKDAPEIVQAKWKALRALADATPNSMKTDNSDDRQELLDLLRDAREAIFNLNDIMCDGEDYIATALIAKIDAVLKEAV